nr:flagellar protein FlaG [uncultured Niameybacter sp.]
MNIESIQLESIIQPTRNSDIAPSSNGQVQAKIGQSIQEVRQHMQQDPSYQPTFQERTILNAIDEINTKLSGQNTEVEVAFHEKTKEMIVRLVNKESKEIVREIPSEKMIDMIASFCEMAGLYIDEKR